VLRGFAFAAHAIPNGAFARAAGAGGSVKLTALSHFRWWRSVLV
jgi:hypothetical protein